MKQLFRQSRIFIHFGEIKPRFPLITLIILHTSLGKTYFDTLIPGGRGTKEKDLPGVNDCRSQY